MNNYQNFFDSWNLIMQSIFGTDGIRGVFNEEITYSLAYKVGCALGFSLKNRFLNKSIEIITIDIIKTSIIFKFVFKIGSRLSDCSIKVLLTKGILNKLNK